MFSEDGLKNMIAESSLALPKDDLTRGRSWTRQTKVPTPPVGAMTLDKTYTYEGPVPAAGAGVDKVTLDTKIDIELAPGANNDFKIKSQEGKGTFLFDTAAGRIVDSTVTEKVETQVTVQKTEITQIHDTSTTMKLVK
jgi:hypothetical protein